MAPLTIHDYRPTDTHALVDLFRDTVRRVNSGDYTPEQIAAWAPEHIDAAAWHTRLQASHTLVAKIGDQVAGFANLEPDGRLDCFYIGADMQRRGVGARLLAAIEEAAHSRNLARLFTEASITARPFFEQHGFSVLRQQEVELRGMSFTNFQMQKHLH